ncbi:class I SAM-dependent methyltransferase [Caldanaerobius polysaccharolyticus]|uniref:class I SAM-dependent methyltransferase n=1 Tax=Caldanaerobius polysaccharolyticus TaxID=44256 RepID=UPI00047B3021|nr:class I SAM-dependent methyltransferase [Caldanaerobius polysaccharolyticus]
MGFYEEISKYYDDIFPVQESQIKLVQSVFSSGFKVLDVACGSGTYTIELAKRGYNMAGIDLSPDMIDIALKKTAEQNLIIDFRVGDMTDLSHIGEKSFDGVMCMGNSLVHLNDEMSVLKALKEFRRVLKENGKLLLQIINFDRVLKHHIESLPVITNPEKDLVFIRKYHIDQKGYVDFITNLTVGNRTFENTIKLLPIQSETLKHLLSKAGFGNATFYGGFDKSPFDSDKSFILIAEAL